jgi:sporulation protein YlmC with PRC-barrel domain
LWIELSKLIYFAVRRFIFGGFLISVDSIIGLNVVGSYGIIVGVIKSAEIDAEKWQVTHIQVKLSSQASEDLGFKKRFKSSVVCVPVSLVTSVGDVILLGRNIKELSENKEIYECK